MKKYKYCIFISKFSPFTNAHKAIVHKALNVADKVIIVIGSTNCARDINNPWSGLERQEMILSSFSQNELNDFSFIHMKDYLYNENLWTLTLQQKINEIINCSENEVAIISFKDDDSAYLKSFPQYSSILFSFEDKHSAKHIRDRYFTYDLSYKNHVPTKIIEYLEKFQDTSTFSSLKEEYNYIKKYRASWQGTPFEVQFNTVDSVVLKSGHILLVKRKFSPGKGLLALPGGFLSSKETYQEAALRELKEETKIGINIPDLKKSIVSKEIFDYPYRSLRGRTITVAFLINLGVGHLPQIKGADDAAKAFWLPLNEIAAKEDQFFEDHFHIINYLINKF